MAASLTAINGATLPTSFASGQKSSASSFMGGPLVRSAPITLRSSPGAAASKPRPALVPAVTASGCFQSGAPRTAKGQRGGSLRTPKAVAVAQEFSAVADDADSSQLPTQYYLQLAAALRVPLAKFQAISAPLENLGTDTKSGVWPAMDHIPSKTMYGDLGGKGNFSQVYKAIVNSLKPVDGSAEFDNMMGDQLKDWNEYRKTSKDGNTLASFKDWASRNYDGDVSAILAQYETMADNPIDLAQEFFATAGHDFPGNFNLYTVDFKRIKDDIVGGTTVSFSFKSNEVSTNTSSAYSHEQGGVGGFLFWAGVSSETTATSLSAKIAASTVTVDVEFAKVIREPVNADKSWFDSSVLSTALNGDTTVWQDPRSKVNFFGDGAGKDGQLARVIDEILVVQGPMSVKVTIENDWSDDERSYFERHTEGGFWPFFSASSEQVVNNVNTTNDKRRIVATCTNNDSTHVQLLGFLISDVKDAFN